MVECKSYVTQITVIVTTKLTVLVIHNIPYCTLRFLKVADTKKYIKPKFLLKPKV